MKPLKDLNVKDVMSQPDDPKNKKSGNGGGIGLGDVAALAPMAMKFLTPKIKIGVGLALFFLFFGIGSFFYHIADVIGFILQKTVLYYMIISYVLYPILTIFIHYGKIKSLQPKITIHEFSKHYEWKKLFDLLYFFAPIILPERLITFLTTIKK